MTKIFNLALIPILFIHLWIASNFELAHDEAYYWLYSHHLDWGYFDHPPMVAVIIKLFSFLPHSELSVRLGFILLQLVGSILLLKLVPVGRKLTALLLFFAFPLASYSGLLALPDLPLLFMSIVYCLLLKRYLENDDKFTMVALAMVIAMLLYSKYHGIMLIFFTILAIPKLLTKKSFYGVALFSILFFLPHMLWQYDHNFATLKYHFFERPKSDFNVKRLLEYSLTQIGLAGALVGPVVWWTIVKKKTENDFERALKWICLGTFFFFFISTFSKKFEANWTIFLAAPLIVLSVTSDIWSRRWAKSLLYLSLGIVFFPRYLLTINPEKAPLKRLKEFHGWKVWANTVDQKCQGPILANTYQMASKLSYYLKQPIHALNYHSRKNQFDFWAPSQDYYPSRVVCFVSDKKDFGGEILETPEGKKLRLVDNFFPASALPNNP